ncbi:MAG: hypothetical protein V4858_06490 [Pseudomonadota bacterium]
MTVTQLIALLQQHNPSAVVVLRDIEGYTGLVPATEAHEVQVRLHARKGSTFVSFFDDDVKEIIDERTTRSEVAMAGVILL